MTLETLLSMFNLTIPFTEDDLRIAKKKVLMLHPDKHVHRKDVKDYYLKYLDAYKKIEVIYHYTKHNNKPVNIDIDQSFKQYVEKKGYKKESFLKHFNHMFTNIHVPQSAESYGYEDWLKSNEDFYDKDSIDTSRRAILKELAVMSEPVPETTYDHYADLKEAHKNPVFTVDEERVLREKPQFKSVQAYEQHRSEPIALTSQSESQKKLQTEYKKHMHDSLKLAYEYKQREEQMERRQKDYNARFFKLEYI
jgi:hypothetical protein